MKEKDKLIQKGYNKGFKECQKMCIKIVTNCQIKGKLDIEDSANFIINEIEKLNLNF